MRHEDSSINGGHYIAPGTWLSPQTECGWKRDVRNTMNGRLLWKGNAHYKPGQEEKLSIRETDA